MVIQEPQNQVLMPTVSNELAFPLENRGVGTDLIDAKIDEIAKLFGLDKLLAKNPDELSGGQITAVAIASCLITDPETIILDEPDSHLDSRMNNSLNKLIDGYKGHKTIIIITQYPDLALDADRVIVLDKGKLLSRGKPDEILSKFNNIEAHGQPRRSRSYGIDINMSADKRFIRESNSDPDPVISLENLSYAYENRNNVIEDINLGIDVEEKLAIIGPSGAGKTTIGLLMASLLKSSKGDIKIKNRPIGDYPSKDLRRLITMAMQLPERALFEETVAKDIEYGPSNIQRPDIDSITAKYLNKFGIAALKDRHPFSLSGGEKRKTALAGILAMESEIIILDEPSAALDPEASGHLIDFLKSLNDRTIIIITHDIGFAAPIVNRFVGLNKGRITFDLPSDKFLSYSQ